MDRTRRVVTFPFFITVSFLVIIFCGIKYYAPHYLVVQKPEEPRIEIKLLKEQLESLKRTLDRLNHQVSSDVAVERPSNAFPKVKPRSEGSRLRILVTGGTGFVAPCAEPANGSNSRIINHPKHEDDPQQRKPDITRAAKLLNWKPKITMKDGLKKTIEYFRDEMEQEKVRIKK